MNANATTEDPKARRVLDLWRRMDTDRAAVSDTLSRIQRFIMPLRDPVGGGAMPGATVQGERFDSTACWALEMLATIIMGFLFPLGERSVRITLKNEDARETDGMREWMDEAGDALYREMTRSGSNTVARFLEAVMDGIGYGTGALFTRGKPPNALGGFAGVALEAWGPGEYVFQEGEDGGPDRAYRRFQLTPSQARERFGEIPGFLGFGEKLGKAVQSTEPAEATKPFWFIHAIEPNDLPGQGGTRAARDYPIRSTCVCEEDKKTLVEGGYQEFPVAISRWSRLSTDRGWGRGPGWTALPDQETLNQIEEWTLSGFIKDIAPTLLTEHRGYVGRINTAPNGIIHVRDMTRRPQYLHSGVRWDVKNVVPEERRTRIRQLFYLDRLDLPETPMSSATEAAIRDARAGQVLAPLLFRFIPELFAATGNRIFRIMLRAGAFPPFPDGRLPVMPDGQDLPFQVGYAGPLTRARQAADIQGIRSTCETGAFITSSNGGDASHMDVLDNDAAMRFTARHSGAPAAILRDEKQVEALRDARAGMEEAQAGLETAARVADIARTAGDIAQAGP